MSSCRIRVEPLEPGQYSVRRTERGDCYGFPINREAYECHDNELDALVARLKSEPSDGIPMYTDVDIVSTPEIQWRLAK